MSAGASALLALSLGELALLPLSLWGPATLGFIMMTALYLLWMPAAILSGATLASAALPLRRLYLPLGGVVVAVLGYLRLTEYAPFVGYLPFILLWSALAVALAAGHWIVDSKAARAWQVGVGVIALASSIAILVAGSRILDTRYPTLLEALLQARFLLLHLGARALLRPAPEGVRLRRTASALVFACGALLVFSYLRPKSAQEQAKVREGSAAALTRSVAALEPEPCEEPPVALSEDEAWRTFSSLAGLPILPESFHVDDFNLLLLLIESTRADTALGTDALGTDALGTKAHLSALRELPGVWLFTHAYAPATRTWLSVSSLFSMTFASHALIETKVPQWTGELLPATETSAELLSAAGYRTAALRHDFRGLEGSEQGFASVHIEPIEVRPRSAVDENLSNRLIDKLAAFADGDQHFFVWTFFRSPHFPYLDGRGNATEQYERAVEHVNAQLARVFSYLEHSGQAKNTIVIVMADHGEELYERHGRHGNSLLHEAIHIPLGVRIPGLAGGVISNATSSSYVLPWLLHSARDERLRAAADARITADIAPIMAVTGGAVVSEIFDKNEDLVSLVWQALKVDFSWRTGGVVVSAPAGDGNYQAVPSSSPLAQEALDKLARFRALRACHQRAVRGQRPGQTAVQRGQVDAVLYKPTWRGQ